METEEQNAQQEKETFSITKGDTSLPFAWGEVKRGDDKGLKFPNLDKDSITMDHLVQFFGEKQAKLVLFTRARVSCKGWYNSVTEKHGGWTPNAQQEFEKLVVEGKISRQTKAEIEELITEIIDELRVWTDKLSDPAEQANAIIKVQELMAEQNRLDGVLKSLSRKRKKDEEDDE